MTMKITTHYKEALTSQMLNYKVETMVGENKVVKGFEVSKNNNNITISPGKCIINGAIIESDEDVNIEVPYSLQDSSDFQVIARYLHSAKNVGFYIYEIDRNLDGNELLLSKSMTDASKMRTLVDLSASLTSIKENLAEDQILEYENEFITSTDSVEGATAELKIKGQTIANVAPIKDEVDVYADLQATSDGSVKFNDTGNGIIDGVNIKGKTYQNLLQGLWNKTGNMINFYKISTLVKPNTTYTVINNSDDTFYIGVFKNNSAVSSIVGYNKRSPMFKFVTPALDDCNGIRVYIRKFDGSAFTEIDNRYFDVVLIEGDHTNNPDLPSYFEGIIGVGDKSKNLLSTNLIDGRIGDQGQWYIGSVPSTTTEFIPVEPSRTYTISKDGVAQRTNIYLYDKNKGFIAKANDVQSTFDTPDNCYFVRLYWSKATIDLKDNVQIEEGRAATPYKKHYRGYKVEVLSYESDSQSFKEYKGSKAEFVLDQPLMRLPNGVCDEIIGNKLIRRVGKINTWDINLWHMGLSSQQFQNTMMFATKEFDSLFVPGGKLICNKFKSYTTWDRDLDACDFTTNNTVRLRIRISRSRLETEDIDGFKKWLQDNEVVIYGELANPIITPIDSDIILPNGVHDKVIGDKAIRNIEQLVLGGSEDWHIFETVSSNDTIAFAVNGLLSSTNANGNSGNFISDKFKFKDVYANSVNDDGMLVHFNEIRISVLKSRLETRDVAGFKKWLKENPTTIWYELKEPYYDTVKIPQLNSYKSQTNIIGSTLIPTPLNIESYGYRKEALIKPNTQYTIHFNNKYADADFKNIKVDLGGAIGNITANNSLLILKLTTPAKLAHNELRISGYGIKISNVMCSEGSEYRDFIDGLAGVGDKSKNLFNSELNYGSMNTGGTINTIFNGTHRARTGFIKLQKGEYWLKSFKQVKQAIVFCYSEPNVSSFIKQSSWASLSDGKSLMFSNSEDFYVIIEVATEDLNSGVIDLKNQEIMLASNSTTFEPYYDGHKIEILSRGKNLCDNNFKYNYAYNGATGVIFGYNNRAILAEKIPFKANQKMYFYIKQPKTDTTYFIRELYLFNNNGDFMGKTGSFFKDSVITMPSYDGVMGITILCKEHGGSAEEINFENEQVELLVCYSDVATSFEPYAGDKKQILLQEPLHSLPNGVCDTIEKIDSNYAVVRRCGQMIIDGSEDWKYHSMVFNGQSVRCILNVSNLKAANSRDQAQLLCDKLIVGVDSSEFIDTNNAVNSIFQRIDSSNAALYIAIKISDCDVRVDDSAHQKCAKVKAWLKDNPVTVWYELAMPMKEGYISQDLNLDTYNETTHITSNTLVPAIINVKIPTNVGAVIKSDIKRIEAIEDLIDKVMLPQLVESHYKKTLLEFDYEVSRMLK